MLADWLSARYDRFMAKMSEIPIWETPEEEREAKLRAIEEGIKAANEGRLIDHETARRWMEDLVAGKRPPIPRARK